MKILTIRFQNLNSLDGEWKIDFNHPTYQINNIFAITGPTGSGKTTLLDAICLALYGRTPRLKTISKSGNEILTRQTGFCFSEITFETLKGCYRCHWSQHRARKDPQGELQQPRHEIVDNSDNKVLENKIKNVSRVVEDVTGMTFEQFTRSILLAQGDFAAFLLAKSDARAPILEQITGTEIYSRISQKVHERTSQEEKNFSTLAEEIENVSILTTEEVAKLQQLMADKLALSKLLQSQIEKKQNGLTWLNTISTIEHSIVDSEKKLGDITTLLHKEESNKLILARAKTASLLQPHYLNITSLRQLQKKETQTLAIKEKEEQSFKKAIEVLLLKIRKTEEVLKATERSIQEEKLLANSVRAIDIRLKEVRIRLDELHKKAQQDRTQRNEQREITKSLTIKIEKKHIHLKQSNEHLKTCAVDENLLENLTFFKEKFDQLDSLAQTIHSLKANLEKNKTQHSELKKRVSMLSEKHIISQEDHKTTVTDLQKVGGDIDKLVSQYPELRIRIEETGDTIHLLEKLHALFCQQVELQEERDRCYLDRKNLNTSVQNDQKEEQVVAEKLNAQEKILRKQEEIVLLATRISSYEEERTRLEPGIPCPLCGALEHPFSEEKQVLEDRAKKLLEAEKNRFDELQKQLVLLQTNITIKLSQINDIINKTLRVEQQLEKIKETVNGVCVSLKMSENSITADLVLENLKEKKLMQQTYRKAAEEIDLLESARTTMRSKADKAAEASSKNERLLQQTMFELEAQNEKNRELVRQVEEYQEKLTALTSELASAIAPYGFTSVGLENYQNIIGQLSEKQENWKQHKRNAQNLTEEIRVSEAELSKINVLLDKLTEDLKSNTKDTHQKTQELENLTSQRHEIYDDKDPDIEEKRLQQNHSETSLLLKKREREYNDCENVLAVVTEQLRALKESTGLRAEQLIKEEIHFTNLLKENNFSDEDELKKHQLSEDEIFKIQTRLDTLLEQKKNLTTLLEEKKKQLQIEKEKNLTSINKDNLVIELAEKNQELSETQQEIGRTQGKLEENANLLAKQKEKRKNLALQKKELFRWQKLDNLIGSASGNKFRNFAQGITFEIMVQHANKNLQKMSDRYILARDKIHPLELNVIDNYRAGVMRTTKNLSGGESFLVSLALALGLSNMASKNVRVDSLFLDEGFGTLDEETLETALQTLASLQQEGKIIGIISHVPLLKERLETQIQVIPGLGGHSRISGPGVSSLQ